MIPVTMYAGWLHGIAPRGADQIAEISLESRIREILPGEVCAVEIVAPQINSSQIVGYGSWRWSRVAAVVSH